MVNTYQPINPTALEALALMRDQAEYRQVTISSTAVGNALCVTQETARRNMRSLVDMNLLEVVVPQKGALAATYRIPSAAVALLDALHGGKARLYKVLPEGRVSGRPFDKPTEWRVDSDVECDEWIPGPAAGGGLFLYATLTHAVTAVAKDEVIMEVTADPTDVFSVGDGVVKARRVHVVEELRWKW